MFDLRALPAHYVGTYGLPKIAEVCGQSLSVVSMWHKRSKFPLDAVAKLLEFDPAPLGAVTPLYTTQPLGKKLAILVPLMGPPEPKMMDCLLKLYDPKEMAYMRLAFNCLPVVRNALAAWALRNGYEWLWWQDGDNIWPAGDATWFKHAAELPDMPDAFAGLHSIYRALYHKKSIVSGVYPARHKGLAAQFGNAAALRDQLRRGPQNRLIEAPWVGFGGVLTHRKVFEDIIASQGNEIRIDPSGALAKRWGYEYSFFHSANPEVPGDDIPWAIRAERAGHKCHVDLAIMGAHVGDRAFNFTDL